MTARIAVATRISSFNKASSTCALESSDLAEWLIWQIGKSTRTLWLYRKTIRTKFFNPTVRKPGEDERKSHTTGEAI